MASYATDGICHNAEPGTFGHECGRPATWIGEKANGFRSGFCNDCKERGWEARSMTAWTAIPLPDGFTWERVAEHRAHWGMDARMIPVVVGPGCVGWGTINSVMQLEAAS